MQNKHQWTPSVAREYRRRWRKAVTYLAFGDIPNAVTWFTLSHSESMATVVKRGLVTPEWAQKTLDRLRRP